MKADFVLFLATEREGMRVFTGGFEAGNARGPKQSGSQGDEINKIQSNMNVTVDIKHSTVDVSRGARTTSS